MVDASLLTNGQVFASALKKTKPNTCLHRESIDLGNKTNEINFSFSFVTRI